MTITISDNHITISDSCQGQYRTNSHFTLDKLDIIWYYNCGCIIMYFFVQDNITKQMSIIIN
jgi:hypothetical protein